MASDSTEFRDSFVSNISPTIPLVFSAASLVSALFVFLTSD